jgi:putative ABC transport system substrate-binding protein
MRQPAAGLVALAPDVILANSSAAVVPLLEASRTVPIMFAAVADPVAAGYVESLARPGGNATGLTVFEYSIGGKWLELLKEVAPRVTQAAVLRQPDIAAGPGMFGIIQALAPSLSVELRAVNVRDAAEIERALTAFAQTPNGGLIVSATPAAVINRDLIIGLAARHRLPAVYSVRLFVDAGGLISYGPDFLDQHRRAAGYVDRILKGAKPADLPVQAPPSTSWSSTSRPPRRSASPCRTACWYAPTRSSSRFACDVLHEETFAADRPPLMGCCGSGATGGLGRVGPRLTPTGHLSGRNLAAQRA